MAFSTQPGNSYPLGATVYDDGVNFCVYSKHATGIDLLLFDSAEAPYPSQTIHLDLQVHRSFYYWHVFVPGVKAGQVYAYRASGPYLPENGHRFDPTKVLLDPYTQVVVGQSHYDRQAACHPGENGPYALRGVVADPHTYDWEGDAPLDIPYADSVIYELHVGGFTRHDSAGVAPEKRGTFAGVIEKIPYLQSLGVTAVELLPIHQFDQRDAPLGLSNYWGYSTVAFFAPHRAYSSRQDPLGPVDEFRDMVKALHRAGIEVILDVVFNHTAEGDERGPTLSFRGLDNQTYYILDEKNPAHYANYSGCGNTVKANHSVVGRLIVDCLRYWVSVMHVDGFRFDLASVMARDTAGHPLENPPILWTIESDPILARTKLIAEAWDAGGLYQVGSFVGDRFAEWNGPFRDDVRQFFLGKPGTVNNLASRILGSPDIFNDPDREVNRSINFVTCHDGFTLADLVTYDRKHNEANGEWNRDGSDANFSWNCGVEGPTQDPAVMALRQRQMRNLLTTLFMSQGTPMVLMGDELGRTQKGNNNAYCQDSPLSWVDWQTLEANRDLWRFTQQAIAFTQNLLLFRQTHWLTVSDRFVNGPHLIWHGVNLHDPDWSYHSHSLAFTLRHPAAEEELHVLLNGYWEPLTFALPRLAPDQTWHRVIDTAQAAPNDILIPPHSVPIGINPRTGDLRRSYTATARSCVVLMAQPV